MTKQDEKSASMIRDSDTGTLNPPSNRIALLTGGGDRPYALGLTEALTSKEIEIDFIGSDDLKSDNLDRNTLVRFLNLKGDQDPNASGAKKMARVLIYYFRLISYATFSKPRIFHILWNNKFEYFDRTILLLYYRLLGKRIVHTAHNVNAAKRDGCDSWLNRSTLKIQYRLCSHLFVHTKMMRDKLLNDFGIREEKVSVIPFGINDTTPNTSLTKAEARSKLGLSDDCKTILFFGNIAPYKGVDSLVDAFLEIASRDTNYHLMIAGRPKGEEEYWKKIETKIEASQFSGRITRSIRYILDEETEIYFKAADVLLLPYTFIFQSGVLFLGYNFGLPIIATDVGSMKDDIVVGDTGFIAKPQCSVDLAAKIEHYFESNLFRNLEQRSKEIQKYATEKYSWSKVADITQRIYSDL